MKLSEWILRKLSRAQDQPEYYVPATEKWNADDALDYLIKAHPSFPDAIKGKKVLDYGCGPGWQTVGIAKAGAAKIVGVDILDEWLEHAKSLIDQYSCSDRAEIIDGRKEQLDNDFDVILSQDSFEHYSDPAGTLQKMKNMLKPGGHIFLVFTGPWYSPFGSHMQVFTPLPWVNILFPENVVMKVRAGYRSDGAQKYEDIDSGLNKMTVARFYRIISNSGMNVEYSFYHGFKGMDFVRHIPIMRELFADQLGCVLTKIE
jgi:SAM-dependent methyltransferase